MKSIRMKLLVYVLGIFIVSVVALSALTYREISHEIEEVFDAELAQTARMISQLALANIDSKGFEVTIPSNIQHQGHRYEKHVSYQVWYRNTLVLRSDSAPSRKAMSDASGYQDVRIEDRQWRVFGLYPESSSYRIYTAEDHKARDELTWEILIETLGIYLWSIPVLGFLIYFTLNKGLSSLEHLSRDVSVRDIDQLRPIDAGKMPIEVLPLINALNELLERLDVAISRERRFTSDASHELRTPLSSIRLHAQNAMNAGNDDDRALSLQQIINAVDQSTHLIEQMLTLSRLDPVKLKVSCKSVDLLDICHELIGEVTEHAKEKNVEVILSTDSNSIQMESNPDLLKVFIRNLLDNAIRYSENDRAVTVSVLDSNEDIRIKVMDNGPGIPEDLLDRVIERFYRLSGQDIDGCGLGLSIANEAVLRLGGELKLYNRHDEHVGLCADITLPKNQC